MRIYADKWHMGRTAPIATRERPSLREKGRDTRPLISVTSAAEYIEKVGFTKRFLEKVYVSGSKKEYPGVLLFFVSQNSK